MKSGNKKRGTRQALLETLNKYCFVFLFAVTLLGQYSTELFLGNDPITKPGNGKSIVCDGSGYVIHLSLDLLFETEPDNSGVAGDESAPNQDRDIATGDLVPASIFRSNIEETSLANFTSCIENRKPVSLVILHHSWKSFIS